MTVLGSKPPANVTINEFTTIASVWTHAQFIDGAAIKGHALGLRIAAGNVPSFVDLATGGWGGDHPGPAQQQPDADDGQLRHARRRARRVRHAGDAGRLQQALCGGDAAEGRRTDRHADGGAVDRALPVVPAATRRSRCSKQFYPVPQGKIMRQVPYMPYLEFLAQRLGAAAEVRRRRLSRGRQGDVRQRGQPLGRRQLHHRLAGAGHAVAGQLQPSSPRTVAPLSPITTGFSGGGFAGGTFGAAVDANDNVWLTSYGGMSISKFDKNGKSLTPVRTASPSTASSD